MSLDLALFRLINMTWGWDGLALLMKFFSTLVYWTPLLVPIVLWMIFRDGRRGRVTVLALILVVAAADQTSSHVLKPLVARPRPCRAESGIEGVRTHGARCSRRGSFPSSHAANAAAVAMLLALRYRRARIPGTAAAFCVGYSRVYLGVHYPSDVAAGWALGTALGAGAAWLAGAGDRFRRGSPPVVADGEGVAPPTGEKTGSS